MNTKELRELTNQELTTRRRDIKQELVHLRVQQQSGQLENPARLKLLRREVGVIETLLNERRRAAAAQA